MQRIDLDKYRDSSKTTLNTSWAFKVDVEFVNSTLNPYLSAHPEINQLIFNRCEIDDDTAIAISYLDTITSLIMTSNYITDIGAIALISMRNLKQLNLDFNNVGNDGVCAIAASDIESVSLRGNQFDKLGYEALQNSGKAFAIGYNNFNVPVQDLKVFKPAPQQPNNGSSLSVEIDVRIKKEGP